MNTFGLIFVLGGVLLMRQVMSGRVKETPQDIKAIALDILNGDFSGVASTLSLRGTNAPPDTAGTVAAGGLSGGAALANLLGSPVLGGSGGDLLATVVELGQSAKGYRLGATGPDYYDCSGLVWAALRHLNLYNGPRFVTGNFVNAMGSNVKKVSTPVAGDIALWPDHMGVVSGTDQMYAAINPGRGIGYQSISGTNTYFHRNAEFYRLSVDATPAQNAPKAGDVNPINQLIK